jgi:hypothetical protein
MCFAASRHIELLTEFRRQNSECPNSRAPRRRVGGALNKTPPNSSLLLQIMLSDTSPQAVGGGNSELRGPNGRTDLPERNDRLPRGAR